MSSVQYSQGKIKHIKGLIGILSVAFILRAIWVLSIPTTPISDFKEYDRLAISLVAGQGYTQPDGTPTAYRPPGYVFFLAAIYEVFGPNQLVARLINILLGVLTCYLTYILARQLFDKRTALISSFLIAVYPSLIAWSNILATENLFLPLLLGVLITFLKAIEKPHVKWFWLFLSGSLTGMCVLIRPAAVILPVVFILFLILKYFLKNNRADALAFFTKISKISLIYVVAILIIMLPWIIRNWLIFNQFIPLSTNGGITLLEGHNDLSLTKEYSVDGPVFDYLNSLHLNEVEYDRLARKLAIDYILHHPWNEIRLLIHKFINLFKDDVSGITYNDLSSTSPLPMWFIFTSKSMAQIFYILVMILAILSIFAKPYPQDKNYLLLLGLIIAWVFVNLIFYGKDRFRLPLTPAFSQFAAIGLLALWDRFPKNVHRKRSGLGDGITK